MDYKVLHFKVTDEMHKAFKAEAAKSGMTMQAFIVDLIQKGVNYEYQSKLTEYTYKLNMSNDGKSYTSLAIPPQKNTGLPKGNEGFVEAGVNKEKLNVLVPGCCKQIKPCKHWQWNGLEQAYINTITGERKEVQ